MDLIFLDIDGVLVNRASFRLPRVPLTGYTATANRAHPNCVNALNHIIAETEARIVLSSVWRMHGMKIMREWFAACGVEATLIGLTPDLNHPARSSELYQPVPRGREIQTWLDGTRRDIESFVIIDDDADMEDLSSRLVQTSFEEGLTMADAVRVIKLFDSVAF